MAARSRIMMISTHGYVGAEPELGKPDTGGQVVYVIEVSKALARLGYHVDILTRRFEGQPREDKVSERCRVLRFPCGGREFIPKEVLCDHIFEWAENARLFIKSRKLRYGAILSHYWDAGMAGDILSQALRVPHIHVPHSIGAWKRDNMDGEPEELERKYNFKRRIREEIVVYDECDALVATTKPQRELLLAGDYDVPKSKLWVIPPGYDDARFFPVSRASRSAIKHDLGYSGRHILALGRVARNKGYDLLVRAMPTVFQRVEDVKLLLAVGAKPDVESREGEGAQIQELRDIAAELGVADRVLFHDYISDAELPDYYRMADVFALSSRYEPFGMTAVEAMACGTPAVVTTEGGLYEQVIWGVEALYANPFDPEAFGHMLAQALQYPEIAHQLAKYGSQKARATYTWMGIAQQLLGIVHALRDRESDGRRVRADAIDEADGPDGGPPQELTSPGLRLT